MFNLWMFNFCQEIFLWGNVSFPESFSLWIATDMLAQSASHSSLQCWQRLIFFPLVTQMRLTFPPTPGLAPSATCLQKCWTRAWIETISSPTSWLTCTVSGSSSGRSRGDVFLEVRKKHLWKATHGRCLQILSDQTGLKLAHYIQYQIFFLPRFISADVVIILPGNAWHIRTISAGCLLSSSAHWMCSSRFTASFPCLVMGHPLPLVLPSHFS